MGGDDLLVADSLLFVHVVSHPCHQSEPVAGEGPFGLFPEGGGHQEDTRCHYSVCDRTLGDCGHVLWRHRWFVVGLGL